MKKNKRSKIPPQPQCRTDFPPNQRSLQQKIYQQEESDEQRSQLNDKMLLYNEDDQPFKPVLPVVREEKKPANLNFFRGKQMLTFPPDKESFYNISNFEEFQNTIKNLQNRYGIADVRYTCRQYKKPSWENLTAYCSSCKLPSSPTTGVKKIVLVKSRRSGDRFVLKYFDNRHNHPGFMPEKAKKVQMIIDQFQKAPKQMTIHQFTDYIQKKHKLRKKAIWYALYKYKKQTENFMQTVDLVGRSNANCWFKNIATDPIYLGSEQIDSIGIQPEIFLVIYNDMHARYQEVGNVCYLNHLNFRLKGITEVNQQWDIITLTGLTLNYIMEPFAIAYVEISHKNSTIFSDIVAKIFDTYGSPPQVLITPSDNLYDSIVQNLRSMSKFKGIHLIDPILQVDRIGSELDRYEDLSYFKNVIFSRTKMDFDVNVQKLMRNCSSSLKIRRQLNLVLKNAHRLCYSHIETPQHIGTIFDYSGSKIIIDNIKESLFRYISKIQTNEKVSPNFKYSHIDNRRNRGPLRTKYHYDFTKLNFSKLTYIRCVKALIMIIRRQIVTVDHSSNYDLKPFEQVVDIPEIQTIRKSIKSNILAIFGQQYGRIYNLTFFQRKDKVAELNELKIYDIYDRAAKAVFSVAPFPQYHPDGGLDKFVFKCNCLFSFKSGIPCAHEILSCMLAKSSLFDLFKKQYTVFQKNKKVGRPKLSRRNQQK